MSEDKEKFGDTEFLSRWSRLKREAREQPADKPQMPAPAFDLKSPAPELPPVDELTINSDFRGFFHPKVDEGLRRAALKKLFSDPHFNVMDGLDTYIDDYSQPNPLPVAMLAQLKQAQKILDWAKQTDEESKATEPAAADHELPHGVEKIQLTDTSSEGSTVRPSKVDVQVNDTAHADNRKS
jgi:hypothetical protein